jgi:hypothetical protein
MVRNITQFLLLVTLTTALCFGQAAAINGQIEGTVTDATGAAVSNANVQIENVGTGSSDPCIPMPRDFTDSQCCRWANTA